MFNVQQKALSLGRIKSTILITLVAITLAVILDILLGKILGVPIGSQDLTKACLIALIIAPFISWYPLGLLFKLDKLKKEMAILATYDDLTGLYNRREFNNQSEKLHQYSARHKQPYAILVIDLDNFKNINDQYGHPSGDSVLTEFGHILRQQSRSGDISGRLGGEEFGLFLPDTNLKQAENFAERLRETIASSQIACDNQLIQYTASIGVAGNASNPKLSIAQVFKNSDHALYIAKNNGRNQVSIFSTI